MIEIIPAMHVMNRKCVRLNKQRDFSAPFVYEETPLDFARRLQDHGLRRLHLIDLSAAAQQGGSPDYDTLQLIAGYTDLFVNFGGGIGNDGEANKAFEYGAKRLTVGTMAATNRRLFTDWLISYGRDRLMLGVKVDAQGKVVYYGPQMAGVVDAEELIGYYYDRSMLYVKVNDVSKDGTLEGPSFELYRRLIERFPGIELLASGGVRNLDDVKRLGDMGVHAAVVSRSIFEHNISLDEVSKYIAQASV